MNITITGGAGFIGHHAVCALAGRGHRITVLDNLRRGSFERPGLELAGRLITGDIRDPGACRAAVNGADLVIHLAAQSNVVGSQIDAGYAFTTNVDGTWNIARAAIAAEVPHLVFASSREVYGEPAVIPVSEEAPLGARNLYGATKIAGEVTLRALETTGFAVSILRLANVIGPGDGGRVVPNWVQAARSGAPLVIFGGTQVLDFVPVATVTATLIRLAEGGPIPVPVNIGSGRGISLGELAARVLAEVPRSGAGIELLPARAIEVTRFVANTTRMSSLLGITPPGDPLAGLADFGG